MERDLRSGHVSREAACRDYGVVTREDGTLADIWQATGTAQTVVCNFPIVAWKRLILLPVLALAMARLRGRRVILVQHEWSGLHRLRRLTYMPALLLAHRIVMFSPLVRRELGRHVVRADDHRVVVVAVPVGGVGVSGGTVEQDVAAAGSGRLVWLAAGGASDDEQQL